MSSRKPQKGDYSPRKLQKCLDGIKGGLYSVSQASRNFNIPRSTLSCKLLKIRPEKKGKCGPEAILGSDNEEKLVTWILEQARRGFPITKNDLLYSVKKLVEECYDKENLPFKNGMPGEKWFRSFLRRHPKVVQKRSEYLSSARASVTESSIRAWFDKVSKILKDDDDFDVLIYPNRMYNLDESAFFMNTNGKVVLAERGSAVYDINNNNDKDSTTISLCVSASGDLAPSLVVYKYVRLPAVYGSSLPPNWCIGTSETGWMNGEVFYEYFANVFIPYKKEKHGDDKIIVFFDGHRSHITYQVSTLAVDNNVIFICLFPNATHICQPLDVAVFKPLKALWKKERNLFEFKEKRNIFKYEISRILDLIFEKNSLPKSMINGFRKCGLSPWEPNNVDYSKCVLKSSAPKPESVPLPRSHIVLDLFESKIDSNILKDFMRTNQSWEGNQEYAELFRVWRSLTQDNQSYLTLELDDAVHNEANKSNRANVSNEANVSNVPVSEDVSNITLVDPEDIPQELLWRNYGEILTGLTDPTVSDREIEIPVNVTDVDLIEMCGKENFDKDGLESNSENAIDNLDSVIAQDGETEKSVQILEIDTSSKKNGSSIVELIEASSGKKSSKNVDIGLEENKNISNDFDSTIEPMAASTPEKSSENVDIDTEPKEYENIPDNFVSTVETIATSTTDHSSPEKSTGNPDSDVNVSTVDGILKSLSRADFIKKTGRQKRAAMNRIPVITSSTWRSMEEAKVKEKEELAKKKEEDRKKKEEDRKKKEEGRKKKEEDRKKKEEGREEKLARRIEKRSSLGIQKEDDGEKKKVLLKKKKRSLSSLIPDEKKKVSLKKKKPAVPSLKDIPDGSWVLVSYNATQYPGLVISHDSDDDVEVSALTKVQIQGKKMWRWPEKEDRIFYTKENVIDVLPAPKVSEGTGRKAGLYSFET